MQVPQHIIDHLKELNLMAEAIGGRKVFLVGGAVRDLMLGKKPKDYDFVTNLAPDLVDGLGFPQVGKSFPVYHTGVGELATTRTERKNGVGYTGFDTAYTASFKEDCLRRDLTINAMLWHHDMGLVCPIERSASDLSEGKLHACSSAFAEDPLRVLRVARFASRCDKHWVVTDDTIAMMRIAAKELHTLPADRVRSELLRVVYLPKFHYVLNSLSDEVAKEVNKWLPASLHYTHGKNSQFDLIEYLSCFPENTRKESILKLGFGTSYVAAANTYKAVKDGYYTVQGLVNIWKSSKRGLDLPWDTLCPALKTMKKHIDTYDFSSMTPEDIKNATMDCAYTALVEQGFPAKFIKNKEN